VAGKRTHVGETEPGVSVASYRAAGVGGEGDRSRRPAHRRGRRSGCRLWPLVQLSLCAFVFRHATGAVTHGDLLLENSVKLPFLNVELPLKAFFVLGPLIFLVVHTYVLLHFLLLAGKVGAFDAELKKQIPGDEKRTQLRRRLPSNFFVQFLAGPREVRTGIVGFLLKSIATITLVAGPIALLILFQLKFLPYHSEWITWWQRITVVADLVSESESYRLYYALTDCRA
jgi:hypothetical protein